MPTISRRLASAGTADPGDLKSPSLPGASPGSPTGVWLIGNSRPVRFKIEQPWECKSPHADQFGMSTGRASRACLLNSALLETGVWCKSTAFRHFRARSSKRAGGFIPRIALDQCRVPERYRTRAPFLSLWCSPANTPASHAGDHRSEAGQGHQVSCPPKHFERCTPLVWEPVRCNSGWGLQIQNGRSRTSVQAGVISQPSPGQHWGLRPFPSPCSSLRISFVKKSCRSITGWRLQFPCSRSPTAETRRRERRQCRCESCREHQFPACKH